MSIGLAFKRASIQPSLTPGDLFEARDFKSLAGLDNVNVFGRLQQREMSSCIEPSRASPSNSTWSAS